MRSGGITLRGFAAAPGSSNSSAVTPPPTDICGNPWVTRQQEPRGPFRPRVAVANIKEGWAGCAPRLRTTLRVAPCMPQLDLLIVGTALPPPALPAVAWQAEPGPLPKGGERRGRRHPGSCQQPEAGPHQGTGGSEVHHRLSARHRSRWRHAEGKLSLRAGCQGPRARQGGGGWVVVLASLCVAARTQPVPSLDPSAPHRDAAAAGSAGQRSTHAVLIRPSLCSAGVLWRAAQVVPAPGWQVQHEQPEPDHCGHTRASWHRRLAGEVGRCWRGGGRQEAWPHREGAVVTAARLSRAPPPHPPTWICRAVAALQTASAASPAGAACSATLATARGPVACR